MLLLSMRCASQATTFSKSVVCRAPGRAAAPARCGAARMTGFEPDLAGAEVEFPPPTPGGVVARFRCPRAGADQPASAVPQSDHDPPVGERH